MTSAYSGHRDVFDRQLAVDDGGLVDRPVVDDLQQIGPGLTVQALQALPAQPYEVATFKTVRVHIDYHVEFDGHRYSVPNALVSQVLEVRATARTVEVLHRGERVASHLRSAHVGGFTTVAEHMPAAHQAQMRWTPQRLVHWGQSIGVATGRTVERMLTERRHPEWGYPNFCV